MIITHKIGWDKCLSHQIWPAIEKGWIDEGKNVHFFWGLAGNNLKELNKSKFDFVFYVAGVDIHLNDRLGKLKISEDGIKRRDEMIINNFFEKNIPICGVLGGGYNKDFETFEKSLYSL